MTKPFPKPQDDGDRRLLANVARYGWGVFMIPEDEEGPGFAYSAGLLHSYDHPEVIVFGLPVEVGKATVNAVGGLVKGGVRLADGDESDEVVDGYPTRFLAVPQDRVGEYFGYAAWLNQTKDLPAVQIVWPDRDGRFPWQADAPDWLRQAQPVLGRVPSKWQG